MAVKRKNGDLRNPGFFAPGLLLCVLMVAGWRSAEPERFHADVRINDKPVRFAYDTGADVTVVFTRPAKRVGLKVVNPPSSARPAPGKVNLGQTEPCRFTVGGETYRLKLATVHLPWLLAVVFDVDGAIGWPDMKDDFIGIDAVAGAIQSVDKLPEDTNGWFKLPIYRRTGVLALEIPRADGKTGVLEVDTGNGGGVSLSPARLKEWRASHPHAHWRLNIGFMPGSGVGIGRMYKAGDLSIGPLRWTNVTVRKATRTEMAIISGGDVSEGSLGMEALRRLNVIIDQKNHAAYFQPRAEVISTNHSDSRNAPRLAAASTVHLDFRERESWDLATEAFDGGKFADALLNVNRFLEFQPDNSPAFVFRGTTRYVTEQWDDAMKDFRRVGELDAGMANYAQFYIWVIRARTGRQAAADQALAAYIGQGKELKGDPWEMKVGAFLLGRLTEADFLRAASRHSRDKNAHRCEAWFYAGIKHRVAGDIATARDYFHKCLATEQKDEDEYNFAGGEVRMLEQAPK